MKLPCDDEGVSEILGYVLILSIAMTALALVLLLIFPSIQFTQDNGQAKEVQQGFTVTDSRLSKARFSTSIFQEAPFNLNEGTVTVDDDYQNSHIIVIEEKPDGTFVEQLYPSPYYPDPDPMIGSNIPLGTIRFIKDNVEVGYQGGGVWVLYDKGLPTERCEMISPPDFDYNTVTLTLPVTRIVKNDDPTATYQGADTISGEDSTINIDSSSSGTIDLRFPDPTGHSGYTNPLGLNPITLQPQERIIKITIKSDYYMGWYSYFEERGMDPEPPDHLQKTVVVRLLTGKGRQETHLENNGGDDNNFNTKHMQSDPDGTPIEIFQVKMVPFDPSQGEGAIGNSFRVNYDSLSATTTNPRLQIYIGRTKTYLNHDYAEVKLIYTYTIQAGNPDAGTYTETFKGYIPFQRKTQDEYIVDLLNTDKEPHFDALDGVYTGALEFYPDPSSPHPSVSWGNDWNKYDAGSEIDPLNNDPLNYNSPTSVYKSAFEVTQHYMSIMGNAFPDTPGNPNSGPVYENTEAKHLDRTGASSLILQYSSDEQIKYLYITEGTLTTGVSSRGSG